MVRFLYDRPSVLKIRSGYGARKACIMIKCPQCGAEQRFDIATQKMKCAYCGTLAPVPEDRSEEAAKETFETNVFTCPNCGGEINSSSEEAAGFCPYCGESVQFGKRLAEEHRPVRIIPFTVSKEQCKSIYTKMIKKARFAPDDMKDPKYIDSFRGIYMPYWVYKISLSGTVTGDSQSSTNMGGYDLVKKYHNSCDVNADFNGPSYDASLSFSDAISRSIAPFDTAKSVKFRSGYIDGFYTDADTVNADEHLADAESYAITTAENEIADKKFPGTVSSIDFTMRQKDTTPQLELFPVWFMSYKNGSRVAYTVINGQSGKIHADIPVDLEKCLKVTALLTLAIGLLLSLLTIIPRTAMRVSVFALLTAALIYNYSLKRDTSDVIHDPPAKTHIAKRGAATAALIVLLLSVGWFILPLLWAGLTSTDTAVTVLCSFIAAIVILVVLFLKKPKSSHGYAVTFILMLASALFICYVSAMEPANDLWYYVPTVVAILVSVLAAMRTIRQMNIAATHRIPQFDRKGGDNRA